MDRKPENPTISVEKDQVVEILNTVNLCEYLGSICGSLPDSPSINKLSNMEKIDKTTKTVNHSSEIITARRA